jgi:hypothetical protein
VIAAAGSPADLPGPWEAVECMDSPCKPGVKILVSTTPTASLCRFVQNASEEQIADQQNAVLGMLRRLLGVLGPIVWAAYWGDSGLVDCERLWVHKGELADLYGYLNVGIASGAGMPELKSSLFGKLASDSASLTATPKPSQGNAFKHLRSRKSMRPSRKKKKRTKAASGPEYEREPGRERQRHRGPTPYIIYRRAIVANNLSSSASGLCELFDGNKILLPKRLREAGSWINAYRTPIHKHAVEQLIYRDRKAVENSKN